MTKPQNTRNQYTWHQAQGPIQLKLTNDYIFHVLMQRNHEVLVALISALLHIPATDIVSAVICNPITIGEKIEEKTYVLDINILLNDSTRINLEMQVINEMNWPDRSLAYLCRSFSSLAAGSNYNSILPCYQIGLLDFTLFENVPEFYAKYQLLNIKNHNIYNDKFNLSVIDLSRIDLATDEDKSFQIDKWASLFKSQTWEELKMLAADNHDIDSAVETIYQASQDDRIQEQCRIREEYYAKQRLINAKLERLTQLETALAHIETELTGKETELQQKDSELQQKDSELKQKDSELQQKDSELQQKDSELKQKDSELASKDALIKELQEKIKGLQK